MGVQLNPGAHGAEGVKRIKSLMVTTIVESRTGFPFLPCAPPSADAQKRKEPRELAH